MLKVAAENACTTYYDWVEYFYQNAPEPLLPWNDNVRLSGAERRAVISSIQQFQLGEGASGARMLERAQRFSFVNAHNRLAPGGVTGGALERSGEPPRRLVRSLINAHNRLAPGGGATVGAFERSGDPPRRLVRSSVTRKTCTESSVPPEGQRVLSLSGGTQPCPLRRPATVDLGLIAALRLFLHEEQRHSRILARFLQLESAPCLRKHWIHTAFRWIRGLAGLELCLKVLVTAEVLARPYYAALRDATASPLLRSICQLIFDEEGAHLRFQAFTLSCFQRRHSRFVQALLKEFHVVLLAATALLVWIEHQAVFKSAGRTFRRFWDETWQEFTKLYRASSAPPV